MFYFISVALFIIFVSLKYCIDENITLNGTPYDLGKEK